MDFFQHRYYRIHKMLMSSVGQWPYQTRSTSRGILAVLLFLYITQVVPQIMGIVQYRDDPAIIIECIAPLSFDGICAAKLITCIFNSQKILKLLNRIREDWEKWSADREIMVLHEYAENGRKIVIVYAVAIYSTGLVFMTEPILPTIIDVLFKNGSGPKLFPIPVYYGRIDMQKYYVYIICYSYVCVSTIIIITIASDVILIATILHGCGLFAAIGHKLKRLGEMDKYAENIYAIKGRDRNYEYLALCVDRHNDALEYAKLVEDTYSWCVFFVVGLNMFMMSTTGLQVVMSTNEPQDVVRYVVFVVAQMFHLYIEMYLPQMLMDASTSIREYIQSGEWYVISVKAQKMLNLITMRSNIPCKLTAGKICVLSVETYTTVVKTSMSYFTLLQSMQ